MGRGYERVVIARGLDLLSLCCVANTKPRAAPCFFISLRAFETSFRALREMKKPRPLGRGFVRVVIARGFEPLTVCLEGRCSIQLSYATIKAVQI